MNHELDTETKNTTQLETNSAPSEKNENITTPQDEKERRKLAKALVSELLEKMTVPAEVFTENPSNALQGDFVCHIRVSEGSNLLIGQRGLNMEALQIIVRIFARQKFDGWSNFSIDVNSYWQKKSEALFSEAKEAETKAHRDKSAVFLRPMTSFERKCIHTALADSELVATESTGFGENRKVIVKPKRDI